MTWLQYGESWVCDKCGAEGQGVPPHARIRSRHHVRPVGSVAKAAARIPTKYVHFCCDDCVEDGDAREVRAVMRRAK